MLHAREQLVLVHLLLPLHNVQGLTAAFDIKGMIYLGAGQEQWLCVLISPADCFTCRRDIDSL